MGNLWFLVGAAGVLAVIIAAGRRWERNRGSQGAGDAPSGEPGYPGGQDSGTCVDPGHADACGDAGADGGGGGGAGD